MSVAIEPTTFRWVRVHKFEPMPAELRTLAEHRGQRFYLFKYALVLVVVLLAMNWLSFSPKKLFQLGSGWSTSTLEILSIGIIAGMCRQLFLITFPRATAAYVAHGISRVPVRVWLAVFVLGAFVEETWRAFTISESSIVGWNSVFAVMLSSAVFVYGRLSGIPSRLTGIREEGIWEFVIGCMLATLYMVTGSVIVPIMVNIVTSTANLYLLRRQARG